ncbi:MAG: phasin family protein [Amaricoccus sp.]
MSIDENQAQPQEPTAHEQAVEAAAEAMEAIESVEDRIIDRVTAEQQELLEAVEATGQAVIEGTDSTRESLVDFVSERIRQNLDAQAALLRCQSFGEVRAIQSRYLKTAVDQYAGEASRLIALGRAVAAKSLVRPGA